MWSVTEREADRRAGESGGAVRPHAPQCRLRCGRSAGAPHEAGRGRSSAASRWSPAGSTAPPSAAAPRCRRRPTEGADAPLAPPPPRSRIREEKLLLAKPQTYMNDSGVAVSELMRFYKLDLRDLLVVCDDLDLPLGACAAGARRGGRPARPGVHHQAAGNERLRPAQDRHRAPGAWPRRERGFSAQRAARRRAHRAGRRHRSRRGAALAWALEGAEVAMNRFNG